MDYAGTFKPTGNKWNHQRSLLERSGCIALSLEAAHRTMWAGYFWPSALCMNSVLLVAPAIRMALEWQVRIEIGRAQNCRPHAWIRTPGQDIIDPTFGMFDGGPPLRVLDSAHSWLLGHWPEVEISLAEEEQLRHSLRPQSSPSGWIGQKIFGYFSDWPPLNR
jgi:hypothetical protein